MQSTGIVRRIDELGRVVIPKEIRKTLGIKEGDPLEIFINEGDIVLKKCFSVNQWISQMIRLREDINRDADIGNREQIVKALDEFLGTIMEAEK